MHSKLSGWAMFLKLLGALCIVGIILFTILDIVFPNPWSSSLNLLFVIVIVTSLLSLFLLASFLTAVANIEEDVSDIRKLLDKMIKPNYRVRRLNKAFRSKTRPRTNLTHHTQALPMSIVQDTMTDSQQQYHCPKCQAKIDLGEDVHFCWKCGFKL